MQVAMASQALTYPHTAAAHLQDSCFTRDAAGPLNLTASLPGPCLLMISTQAHTTALLPGLGQESGRDLSQPAPYTRCQPASPIAVLSHPFLSILVPCRRSRRVREMLAHEEEDAPAPAFFVPKAGAASATLRVDAPEFWHTLGGLSKSPRAEVRAAATHLKGFGASGGLSAGGCEQTHRLSWHPFSSITASMNITIPSWFVICHLIPAAPALAPCVCCPVTSDLYYSLSSLLSRLAAYQWLAWMYAPAVTSSAFQ